jgi:hypothetical protein
VTEGLLADGVERLRDPTRDDDRVGGGGGVARWVGRRRRRRRRALHRRGDRSGEASRDVLARHARGLALAVVFRRRAGVVARRRRAVVGHVVFDDDDGGGDDARRTTSGARSRQREDRPLPLLDISFPVKPASALRAGTN